MPAGIRALRQIHFGQESSTARGVAVTPTAFVVGKLNMRLEQELFMPAEYETGKLASFERSRGNCSGDSDAF